jgi:probable HAF family extracellular repeat protein
MGTEGFLGLAANCAIRLVHAALWGGLFILGVGAFCRLVPRLPASVRAGLWWLACLKLVFDLFWAAPIALPLLPAHAVRLTPAVQINAALPFTARSPVAAVSGGRASFTPKRSDSRPTPDAQGPRFSPPLGLLVCWLAGVSVFLLTMLRQGVHLARTVRAASTAPLAGVDPDALAAALGLRCALRVLQHPACRTPCVTGWLRPAILLPPDLAQTLTTEELRLTLAHEMAHVRRGDLWLALLPALARALFFFHPLAWWASAEWGAAREEACDALALGATGASTVRLAHLLLRVASGETRAPALGLSPGYHGLRRRLIGLTRGGNESRSLARWLLACALPLLLPWRLTAAVRVAPAAPSRDAASSGYGITDLGSLTNGDVTALNGAGQIAGAAPGPDNLAHGILWDEGRPLPLGALPKHHASIAYGLNSRGQAAGASYNIPGRGRAFLWDGVPRRIGSLPGFPYSEARGVNDAGQVAGSSETGGHDRWRATVARAFLWDTGEMTDLGTLGGPYSRAYGLNNAGVVVGKADTSVFGQTHAFAWSGGQMQDLGTLGGANSLAYHINDRGQAVGYSETGVGGTRHAFLTTEGHMCDLGTVSGLDNSVAFDINSAGEAVGAAAPAPDAPSQRALLWHNGQTIDLNRFLPPASGWTLDEAHAINDRGQIAGRGRFHGQPCAFLLTPH